RASSWARRSTSTAASLCRDRRSRQWAAVGRADTFRRMSALQRVERERKHDGAVLFRFGSPGSVHRAGLAGELAACALAVGAAPAPKLVDGAAHPATARVTPKRRAAAPPRFSHACGFGRTRRY